MEHLQSNLEHSECDATSQEYRPSSAPYLRTEEAIANEVASNTTISILTEIPEDLHKSLKGYLDGHPDWDQDRVFAAALSLFLLQNGDSGTPESSLNYRRAARVYLETLFRYSP
jgi:Protein of unknown function (DUF2811)